MSDILTRRSAGVLLHPTSLPSGTLADAPAWLDFLHTACVGVWQMLPLGIPLGGLSPYQCASAFALNPTLFGPFIEGEFDTTDYERWRAAQAHWIDDFALFSTLKQTHQGRGWTEWPMGLRARKPTPLKTFARKHTAAIEAVVREQYACAVAWRELRTLASERGVALFGDMPIFVAHDSADVWAHPEIFLLDADGNPTVVTGVPPDYFSETGQRWGNPHYNWASMAANDYLWWRQRLCAHFECFDLVRIDHFRGFAAAWTIPATEPTAINGHWVEAPGVELLEALARECGGLPLVAEDLGIITPDVTALRRRFDLPGMSVLQFAFDAFTDNPHKPENVEESAVYYVGTHDNDTLAGWWANLDADARNAVMARLACDESHVPAAMLETVFASRANLAVVTLQDLLGLGSEARMNTPGTVEGNWAWRMAPDALAAELASSLQQQLIKTARCPK